MRQSRTGRFGPFGTATVSEGRVRNETRELAYKASRKPYGPGPAVVNAEIERRIAMSSYEDRLRRTTDLNRN
jgi:hypothetical protein